MAFKSSLLYAAVSLDGLREKRLHLKPGELVV
jgi:hypothetical protein